MEHYVVDTYGQHTDNQWQSNDLHRVFSVNSKCELGCKLDPTYFKRNIIVIGELQWSTLRGMGNLRCATCRYIDRFNHSQWSWWRAPETQFWMQHTLVVYIRLSGISGNRIGCDRSDSNNMAVTVMGSVFVNRTQFIQILF